MLVLSNLVSNYYYYTRLNGLFFRTTWVSQYQKGKTSLDVVKRVL